MHMNLEDKLNFMLKSKCLISVARILSLRIVKFPIYGENEKPFPLL